MATTTNDEPPTFRPSSPSPDVVPRPALGAYPELRRTLSTVSSLSHGSSTTDASNVRESLGSDFSNTSRHSSASFTSVRRDPSARYSIMSVDRAATKRRGYMRPQGTDFAASARSRESVLSLGSIAHLQYYFARTGLLDGKGGQLARKRQQKVQTLDLSQLDSSGLLSPGFPGGSDTDSSYASMGSSPDLVAHGFGGASGLVESPVQEHPDIGDDDWDVDDLEEPDPDMLPPTVSTYHHREKPLPKPPSLAELKADLTSALDVASRGVKEARTAKEPTDLPPTPPPPPVPTIETPDGQTQPQPLASPGWYEVQGMHILDVMTLAIRAAKVYYTSHEHPDRLDAIKPEKEVRSELLGVMDVLKRMATRGFAGGMREEEFRTMEDWIAGLRHMLAAEEEMEAAERAERASWKWLRDEHWTDPARAVEREHAFLVTMLDGASPAEGLAGDDAALPPWDPIDRSRPLEGQGLPTPFLRHMQNGIRLVQLHNCAVRKSRRRFGAIPSYHVDTQKPYRCADNLRYWVKAAELRWEVMLKLDALGVVYGSSPEVWLDFEDAILKWCRKVREEIAAELVD